MYYVAAFLFFIPKIYAKPITIYLVDGKEIRFISLMSLYIFDEIYLDKIYDYDWKSPPKTVIDIGANTGMFVLRAKQLWPSCSIFCYEPELTNFAELEHTIRVNNLPDVAAVNAAIMPHRGEVLLYHHPRNIGGHSVVHQVSNKSTLVKAETLNDALARLPRGICDLLKIDCEGAEGPLLRSLSLETARYITSIAYEPDWGHYSVDDLNSYLEQCGYAIVKKGGTVFAFQENLP
jgi:FkbM family methyltransferase